MKRYFLAIIIFIFVLGFFIIDQWPDDQLHVVICDVGQGDAILVTQGFWQMLVDGGPDDSVQSCLSQHMPFWDRSLELVVATHADQDHIGGLSRVFEYYQVGTTLISDWKATQTYQKLFTALKQEQSKGMKLKTAFFGQLVRLSPQLQIQILWPNRDFLYATNMQLLLSTETSLSDTLQQNLTKTHDNNDRSIGLYLQYKQFDFLLLGDLSQKGEIALTQKSMINKIETLKVGHHGAKTSSNPLFLHTARPEISLISCGSNNPHGHPSEETMRKLKQLSTSTFDTSKNGTIELISDGEVIKVQTGHQF
jgi:competence protein ComEC